MGYRVKDERKWPGGKIPVLCSAELMQEEHKSLRKVIKGNMNRWEQFINTQDKLYVEFIDRTDEEKYVEISLTRNGSTSSGEIGAPPDKKNKNDGPPISKFTIMISQGGGFDHRSSIPHELGHILGLAHEHQRSRPLIQNGEPQDGTGDEVTAKDSSKARLYYLGGWKTKKEMFADWDKKYVPVGEYDLQSIMHYPSAGGWQWNYVPYQGDKGRPIAIAALNYPSAQEAIMRTWAPSPGDIAAIRELYR